MSLTTRKKQAQAQASAGLDLARQTATRVTPVAMDAAARVTPAVKDAAAKVTPAAKGAAGRISPLARTAGETARQAGVAAAQGVQGAGEWARPRLAQGVHHARVWAAPRIEQAGRSLSETVAPKVSDMVTAAARRVEPDSDARKRRLWPKLVAGAAVITALGGIFAALRRRRVLPDDVVMPEDTPDDMADPQEPDSEREGEETIVEAEVGVNGHRPTS